MRSATRVASRSLGDVVEQHGELVAAEARHDVARAQRLLEARADLLEQLVAGLVAEASLISLKRSRSRKITAAQPPRRSWRASAVSAGRRTAPGSAAP